MYDKSPKVRKLEEVGRSGSPKVRKKYSKGGEILPDLRTSGLPDYFAERKKEGIVQKKSPLFLLPYRSRNK